MDTLVRGNSIRDNGFKEDHSFDDSFDMDDSWEGSEDELEDMTSERYVDKYFFENVEQEENDIEEESDDKTSNQEYKHQVNNNPESAADTNEQKIRTYRKKLAASKPIKNFQKSNGKVMCFSPEDHQFCEIEMGELILRGMVLSHARAKKEKENPVNANVDCNMQKSKDNIKQKVYVIKGFNKKTLGLIFRAF